MVRKYLKKAANYALNRLKERSTRIGLIAFCASVGVALDPAQLEQWVAIGGAVMGVIEAIAPDKPTDVIALEK